MGFQEDYEAALAKREKPKAKRSFAEEYEAARPVELLEGVQQVSSSIGRGSPSTVPGHRWS